MVTRHEFLAQLHTYLRPRGYLEIGVLFGDSLRLAKCPAIGIDPNPQLRYHLPSYQVITATSDEFFDERVQSQLLMEWWGAHLDLAFIDGMHLFEYALRDFLNVEKYSNPRTVVVFDDVLPRNQHEAAREQCPGDWTGDVWKVPRLLSLYRPELEILLVDTEPTGTALVWKLDPTFHKTKMISRIESMGLDAVSYVPDDVISRDQAVSPSEAIGQVTESIFTLELEGP